jgi:predicted O-methyltransferase YrrM
MRNFKEKSYEYIENLIGPENEIKQKARTHADGLGLGRISLSPVEAVSLQFFAESIQAKKLVEIGTLTGLSALYLLEGLSSDACLWTLEKSAEHAALAGEVLQKHIDQKRCRILVGDAQQTLKDLVNEGPFDMVFIDGNKAAYLDYFNWALANIRPGGYIVVDNVFLSGAVWGEQTQQRFNEKQIKAVHTMNDQAFHNSTLRSMLIPTQEGLLVCQKRF